MKNDDLRKTPRLPHVDHYQTNFTVLNNNVRIEHFVAFEMKDLNFQGMGVQTEQPLPVDAVVNFDIDFDGQLYNVTAKVLWTKRFESHCRSGLGFEYIPDELIIQIKRFLSDGAMASRRYPN